MTDSPARTHAQSAEVERVTGVRLVPKAGTQVMSVEYRIQWKDVAVQTWCVVGKAAAAQGAFVSEQGVWRSHLRCVACPVGSRLGTWQTTC